MLGHLGAILIVFAVTHLAAALVLAWRPYLGPASTLVTTAFVAGGGCVVAARLMSGQLGVAVAAAVPAFRVIRCA